MPSRTYRSIWSRGARVAGPIGTGQIMVALAFKFTAPGKIVAFSFLRDGSDSSNHLAHLIHQLPSGNVPIERVTTFRLVNPAPGGSPAWQTTYFHPWLKIVTGDLYELVVHFGNSKYSNMIAARSPDPDIVVGPITVPGAASGVTNGLSATTLTFLPQTSMSGAKPAIDILFRPD